MFIMNIFENQKTADIVNESILFSWMEMYHILIFAIETNRVL